jgi:hypothetical protein
MGGEGTPTSSRGALERDDPATVLIMNETIGTLILNLN